MLPWVALCLAKRSCRQRGRPTKPPPSKNDALSEHEVFRLARDRVARAMVRTTCLLVSRESAPFLLQGSSQRELETGRETAAKWHENCSAKSSGVVLPAICGGNFASGSVWTFLQAEAGPCFTRLPWQNYPLLHSHPLTAGNRKRMDVSLRSDSSCLFPHTLTATS
jgi:hypothetical protein